jgi:uncharacterized protein YecE (DUF72 family)
VKSILKHVRIGTSGWSYDDWDGVVYPDRAGLDRLAYLARYFETFEVNSSFYRPPSARMTASWLRRTPPNVDFTFKLHRRFTHERAGPYTRAEVDEFRRGIEPILEAGRLGALLGQFPWSFRFDEQARLWLDQLARDFRHYRLVVEVRHASWAAMEAMDFLRGHNLNLAAIDQPELPGNLPPVMKPTGPTAYVRLHGRNKEQWFASMRAPQETEAERRAARNARYDYLYGEDELREWAQRIAELAGKTQRTYVFANNHFRGQAPANALQLKSMIFGRKVAVPETMIRAFDFLEKIAETEGRQRSLF